MKETLLQLKLRSRTFAQLIKLLEDYDQIIRVGDSLKGTFQQIDLSKAKHFAQGFINLNPSPVLSHQRHSGGMIKSAPKKLLAFTKRVHVTISLPGLQL